MATGRQWGVRGPAEVYTRPRYTEAEAARIVEVRPATFRNWAHGYAYRTTTEKSSPALTTLAEAGNDRLLEPFVGLAEAQVLAAFEPPAYRCSGAGPRWSGSKQRWAYPQH